MGAAAACRERDCAGKGVEGIAADGLEIERNQPACLSANAHRPPPALERALT